MTNPYSGGNDDFPRYEPTDHPEDRPNYGQLPSYGGCLLYTSPSPRDS